MDPNPRGELPQPAPAARSAGPGPADDQRGSVLPVHSHERCAVTASSDIGYVSDGPVISDVLLLGAAGNSGQLIAAELAARGLSLRLAGRSLGSLEALAAALAADGAATEVRAVDASDAASLAEVITGVGVVLSTIGPFARRAGPVIDACLAAAVPYVDIANEWPAVRGLLDRDEQARARGIALVTGAGFGP